MDVEKQIIYSLTCITCALLGLMYGRFILREMIYSLTFAPVFFGIDFTGFVVHC